MNKKQLLLMGALIMNLVVGETTRLWVGTGGMQAGEGIYTVEVDEAGQFQKPRLAAPLTFSTWVQLSKKRPLLYAVCDSRGKGGTLHAFRIEGDQLTEVSNVSSQGKHPCHLSLNADENLLFAANYVDGTTSAWSLDAEGKFSESVLKWTHKGSGPHPDRQKGPHAHSVVLDPSERFLLGCDLGTDEVLAWKILGSPMRIETPPTVVWKSRSGAGPRHFAIHPKGGLVAIANELENTVDLCRMGEEGKVFEALATIPALPNGEKPTDKMSLAEIAWHPNGRFLYVSMRGKEVICLFELKGDLLEPRAVIPSGGETPRHFEIMKGGKLLIVANQGQGLTSFAIDENTGNLERRGEVSIPLAACVISQ
jgi:6-phosphogluconolactonase (cycloisomerase 2 family)